MKNNSEKSKKKPTIIIGSGAHANVLAEVLVKCGRQILGFTDQFEQIGKKFKNIKVLGRDDIILKYDTSEIELVNGIAGLNTKDLRQNLAKSFQDKGFKFANVIHPSAIISDSVVLDDGVQIMAGVILQNDVHIGFSSIINTGAIIDHDCIIKNNCNIAPGVVLNGNVIIGERTHLGTGTMVIENKKIGKDCIIAAGSVINKDIPSNTKLIQSKTNKTEVLV